MHILWDSQSSWSSFGSKQMRTNTWCARPLVKARKSRSGNFNNNDNWLGLAQRQERSCVTASCSQLSAKTLLRDEKANWSTKSMQLWPCIICWDALGFTAQGRQSSSAVQPVVALTHRFWHQLVVATICGSRWHEIRAEKHQQAIRQFFQEMQLESQFVFYDLSSMLSDEHPTSGTSSSICQTSSVLPVLLPLCFFWCRFGIESFPSLKPLLFFGMFNELTDEVKHSLFCSLIQLNPGVLFAQKFRFCSGGLSGGPGWQDKETITCSIFENYSCLCWSAILFLLATKIRIFGVFLLSYHHANEKRAKQLLNLKKLWTSHHVSPLFARAHARNVWNG